MGAKCSFPRVHVCIGTFTNTPNKTKWKKNSYGYSLIFLFLFKSQDRAALWATLTQISFDIVINHWFTLMEELASDLGSRPQRLAQAWDSQPCSLAVAHWYLPAKFDRGLQWRQAIDISESHSSHFWAANGPSLRRPDPCQHELTYMKWNTDLTASSRVNLRREILLEKAELLFWVSLQSTYLSFISKKCGIFKIELHLIKNKTWKLARYCVCGFIYLICFPWISHHAHSASFPSLEFFLPLSSTASLQLQQKKIKHVCVHL